MKHRDDIPFDLSPRFETNDEVECIATGYYSIKPGQRRIVRATLDNGPNYHLWLDNEHSPKGGSWYNSYNFKLVKRRNPSVAKTLHIAVQISDSGNEEFGYDYIADHINDLKFSHLAMMAETSGEKLKSRVGERVNRHPEERWLILSGHILAEISAPPVRFRPA